MGNSESKNTVEMVNDITQEVIMETIQNCQQNISQEQIILISNASNVIVSNINMEQYASFDASCVLNKMSSVEFENNLKAAIKQFAETEAPPITLSDSSSENVTKHTNIITNTVKELTKQDCMANIFQSQSIIVTNATNIVVDDITFNQMGQITLECLLKNDSYTKAVNDIATIVDQHAVTEVSILGDLFGFLGDYVYAAAFVILSCFCLCSICPSILVFAFAIINIVL